MIRLALKVIILVFLLLDGFFHFFGDIKTIQTSAPDWMIAEGLFGRLGMDTASHRAIGAWLIISSMYALYVLARGQYKSSLYAQFYYRIIAPIALIIIGSGVGLKIMRTTHNST